MFKAIAACDDAIGQVVAASGFEISIGDTASLIGEVMNVELEIITDEKTKTRKLRSKPLIWRQQTFKTTEWMEPRLRRN